MLGEGLIEYIVKGTCHYIILIKKKRFCLNIQWIGNVGISGAAWVVGDTDQGVGGNKTGEIYM